MKTEQMELRGRREPKTWLAEITALFSLGILPLAFRNAFFDINRFKVELVLYTVPVIALAKAFFSVFRRKTSCAQRVVRDVRLILYALAAFLGSCIISSAICSFSSETLFGTNGRYCGLFFLLCCGMVFLILVRGALCGDGALKLTVAAASAVSLLGIFNAVGVDPLQFYQAMRLDQLTTFLSTIGNVDFFGAYLAICYPLAAAKALYAQEKREKRVFTAAACLIACGVVVSRSDSAFFALQLSCLILTALAAGDYERMRFALILWSISCALLPLMKPLLWFGKWMIPYSGVLKALCDTGLIWLASALLFCLALLCKKAMRGCAPAPGRKRCLLMISAAAALVLALLLALMMYFTLLAPEVSLGAASSLLRFDGKWGTGRGMIYRGAGKAYCDFAMPQKLFGGGVDCAVRILLPYMENTAGSLVFNDAHCQPLQFLLTTGIFGAGAYMGFYLLMLRASLKNAGDDPLLCGVFASLCGYAVIAMLGVTQPIIMMSFFSIAALAASRIQFLNHMKRRESDEP